MKKQLVAIFYVVLFAVAGCSGPKEVIVPLSPGASRDAFRTAMGKLNEEERQLVKSYMMRTMFANGMLGTQAPPVTIAQAIEEQRTFKAEKEAKAMEEARLEAERAAEEERIRAEAEAKLARMRKMADVYLVNKELRSKNRYQKYIQIVCNIRNNHDEAMSGLKGSLILNNTFGEHIFTLRLTVEEPIPPGGAIEWVGDMEYNQFISEHEKIANAEMDKIRTVWVPDAYLFSSGEVVN